jgi:hypothetical protein
MLAANPGVIGWIVLARRKCDPDYIAIDPQRRIEVRHVEHDENQSIVCLHYDSVLSCGGSAALTWLASKGARACS